MINKVSNQKYYEYSKISQQKRGSTESSEFHLNPGDQGVVYERGSQKKAEKSKGAAVQKEGEKAGARANTGVKVEISRQAYNRMEAKRQGTSLVEGVQKYVSIAINFLKSLWNKVWADNAASPKEDFPDILEGKLAEKNGAGDAGTADATSFFGGMQPSETDDASFFGGMQSAETVEDTVQTASPALDVKNMAGSLWDWISKTEKPDAAEEPVYTQEEIRRIFRRGNRQEIEDFLSNHGKRRLAKNTELLTQYDKKGTIVGIDHAEKELILFGNKNEIRL